MTPACKEILFDLFSGQLMPSGIPDSIATDGQAVDWLFHLLHAREYPSHELIEFLGKHCPDDRRFRLWKNRAFRPGLGEDGMASQDAYQFLERHEPDHPWLDPFMEQAAYEFHGLMDGFYAGKDFKWHLRYRFEERVGSHDPESDISGKVAAMERAALEQRVTDSGAVLKERLHAAGELLKRHEFGFLFNSKLDHLARKPLMERARAFASPALLAAARERLVAGEDLHTAFEILLSHCTGDLELLDLFERAVELKWPGKSRFLAKIRELGNAIPLTTVRRIVLLAAEENRFCRREALAILLDRCGDDPDVISRIKSWAEGEPEDYGFSIILSHLLDANLEREWVREAALAFQRQHDGNHSILQAIARIGDEDCIQVILDALDSSLSSEMLAAVDAGCRYLHENARFRKHLIQIVRERMIGKIPGYASVRAFQWIAWRYPEDPEMLPILEELIDGQYLPQELTDVMCLRDIRMPKLKERFLKSLADPSNRFILDCTGILAIRAERESLAGEMLEHWERLSFSGGTSSIYPTWFSWQPLSDEIPGRIRSGDFLERPRELILQISAHTDVSEALREGIRAAIDKMDLNDTILLLGLIYGDRPETVRFLKELIELEPAMVKYGAEAAFAEVLRLGKRGPEDFQWALAALRSSRRASGGIASRGPRILVHFFGSGAAVVEALQGLALYAEHPHLADAATRLLMDAFPDASPVDTRLAIQRMSATERADYFHSLKRTQELDFGNLTHFALHDPDAPVRRAAMTVIWQTIHSQAVCLQKPAEGWRDRDFAVNCLAHEDLAESAAGLLAMWYPEDEAMARLLTDALDRFPNERIFQILCDSFGHTECVRELLLEIVGKSRKAAAAMVGLTRQVQPECLGFDPRRYTASMLRLHFPPFDQLPEAMELRQDILKQPWLASSSYQWKAAQAVTYGLDDAEKILKYEEIIRSGALEIYRRWMCGALAGMAGTDDQALERLLVLLEDPDEGLRKLVAKSCDSVALNERRNHRKLHDLLRKHGA